VFVIYGLVAVSCKTLTISGAIGATLAAVPRPGGSPPVERCFHTFNDAPDGVRTSCTMAAPSFTERAVSFAGPNLS